VIKDFSWTDAKRFDISSIVLVKQLRGLCAKIIFRNDSETADVFSELEKRWVDITRTKNIVLFQMDHHIRPLLSINRGWRE